MAADLHTSARQVLVTGATGYIGGRLVPRLLAGGYRVRCVARDATRLGGRSWPGVEVVEGDLANSEAVARAVEGIDVAYYLVHSMAAGPSFRERDHQIALLFGAAAARAGVECIIYLGGLGDPSTVLSKHLLSRHDVGRTLASSGVPVVEFRAGLIVGSGSASFEMIRHLTENLPVMVTPRWVERRCQPIGVRTVLEYLLAALEEHTSAGVFEIGGPDVLTYREMMLEYARLRDLRRLILPLDVPHPEWSSQFISLLTPIPRAIVQPLLESLDTDVVVRDDRARATFAVEPLGYSESVRRAIARVADDEVETTWASSMTSVVGTEARRKELAVHEGMLLERHVTRSCASAPAMFGAICSLGGEEGWPAGNLLWQVRGALDRLVGGVGMRRGRRHPRELLVGEPLDFWRVEALEPGRLLRMRAEMKLPGVAWLQFEIFEDDAGAVVQQTAFFDPHGVLGHLYWYALLPFHRFIFPGLIRAIREKAEAGAAPHREQTP